MPVLIALVLSSLVVVMLILYRPLVPTSFRRIRDRLSSIPGEKHRRNSRAAIADFFRVAQAWQLDDEEARRLLGVSHGVFRRLKRGQEETLEPDKLARLSLLLGIYKGLNVLYSRRQANAWVHLPNAHRMFDGQKPLDHMLKGGVEALISVQKLVGVWSGYSPSRR